jgi:putative methionine-R-sulfoxide reductase with GAF domain
MNKNVEDLLLKVGKLTNLKEFAQLFLWTIAKELEASQGAFFVSKKRGEIKILSFVVGYAYHIAETETIEFEYGEGLSGQVAKEGKMINISTVPDGYISILSGLGKASPNSIVIFPLKRNDEVIAVVELASFKKIEKDEEDFLLEISSKIESLVDHLVLESQ